MSKRPPIDLLALTSEQALPMAEAVQRSAPRPAVEDDPRPLVHVRQRLAPAVVPRALTENLEGLAFKVSPEFRRRFRSRAAEADLKLNELLFEAFEAWEIQRGFRK